MKICHPSNSLFAQVDQILLGKFLVNEYSSQFWKTAQQDNTAQSHDNSDTFDPLILCIAAWYTSIF